jgi:hypothetical protein
MTTSQGFLGRLPFWIAASFVVALVGFFVAGATDDNTAPYDDSAVSTVAWVVFLVGAGVFIVLCAVAVVIALRRDRPQRT